MNSFMVYLMESAACLVLFYGAFRLFLRQETYFKLNRVYLVCALILSLILPAFRITSPFITVRASSPTGFLPSSAVAVKTWSLGDSLLLLYVIGAGVFLARFIFHMVKLTFVVRKYEMTRINGVKIVSVDRTFSPFSFLNYIFINDKAMTEHNMRRIIAHEVIHIKQYHTFDILLMEFVTVLQWFNPFVWPYKKSLQETHEFLADYGVIAQGFSPAKYQLLMFEQHVGMKLFEFANNFKQSQIKRRITMISQIKSRSVAKLKLLLIVPLATLLLLAFAEPKPADTQIAEALGADMLGIKVADRAPLSADQDTDQNKEQEKKKKMEQIKTDLANLKKEEQILRKELEATDDSNKKLDIKSRLKDVLTEEKVLAEALENGELPPPPKAPSPPAAPSPPPKDLKMLEKEYKILAEKEEALKMKLDKITDPTEKSELKAALVEVMSKQDKLESYMAEFSTESNGGEAKIDELKSEYNMLGKKAEDLIKKIKNTDDPDTKAKLKQMLADVQKKQEKIEVEVEAIKTGKKGKVIK